MAEERTESAEELRDQLDLLWEKHLTLLDNYQQAQQQLGRYLSSGFFSLAQASFKSTSRIRYGQDYYDDRMQATRRYTASVDDDDDDDDVYTIRMQAQSEGKPAQQPTPPSTPPSETEQGNEKPLDQISPADEKEEKDGDEVKREKAEMIKKPQNPLHWYGILVPPQLRASQKSFISATEDPIIDACNNAQALRKISLEIKKLRKDIKRAEKNST